ncbi:MAG: RNA 2',3'-cyclic phosphodiesterase [Candidatus Cloacimonetes bacterium]|nr:RNA 2',3'-cyclic phosphodiesterase [Candidatus Cloacimonadota bacterium]
MQIRTFIALELPNSIKQELQGIYSRFSLLTPPGVNWVKPENMHLTLLFIGDVEQNRICEIDSTMQRLLLGFPAFNFTALGLELFPAVNPRIIWLKLGCENEDIFKLHRRLLRELDSLGINADRKAMRLHITLARLKTALSPELEREILQFKVQNDTLSYGSISLFRSVLAATGPSYTVLEKYNLQ